MSVSLSTLWGCGAMPDPVTSAVAHTGDTDPRVQTLDRMRSALEARDAHALAALYADDAVLTVAGAPPVRGRAAIEAALAAQLGPAQSVQVALSRVWLADRVAILEVPFRASHAPDKHLGDVGTTDAIVLWFDAGGRIVQEHDYQEQGTIDAQAAREADAPALPTLPATTEVHRGPARVRVALADELMAASSTSDDLLLARMDEQVHWDCVLGLHGTSRSDVARALAHLRQVFPHQAWKAVNAWAVDDYVLVEEQLDATQDGKFGDLEASHRPITWHFFEVWKVDGDRVVRGWTFANFEELEHQVAPERAGKPHLAACSVPA
jgi:uncharacterized protein (TIGR02246 family)